MSVSSVLKRIRIEPFLLLFMFSTALEGITITQLAQDKICIDKYHQSIEYCSKLSQQIDSDSEHGYKNQILADVTQFNLYKTLITAIPVIFWSLFLGSWADRHSSAPKILMSLAAISSVLETSLLLLTAIYFKSDVNYMLLASIPFPMFGGLLSITMSLYSYISSTSEPELITIRFAIIESLIFIATPLGLFFGGKLISGQFIGSDGQLHDYMSVFIIGLIAQILAVIWIILIPFEKKLSDKVVISEKDVIDFNYENDLAIETAEQLIERSQESEPLIDKSMSHSNIGPKVFADSNAIDLIVETVIIEDKRFSFHIFNDLIDLQNIKDMINTCTKPRTDGKRSEIWILFMSLVFITLTNNGSMVIMFQFVQKVFQWDAEIYSIVNSSVFLITAISVAVIVPLLIKVFKITDISLSIIGVLTIFIQNLIRGTFLNVIAFYFSFIFGSLAYVPPISVRSKLSKIVDKNEENKVFGLLSSLETLTPFIASIIYSTIFSETLASYPGIVFQISAAFLIIPLLGFMYISVYCEQNYSLVNKK